MSEALIQIINKKPVPVRVQILCGDRDDGVDRGIRLEQGHNVHFAVGNPHFPETMNFMVTVERGRDAEVKEQLNVIARAQARLSELLR